MKNNKLLSVLLALLVCLSMVVSVSATEEADLIFALESADSSVEELDAAVVGAGKQFTVTVDVVKNPGIITARTLVKYDNTKLELVSVATLDEENIIVNETEEGVRVTVGNFNFKDFNTEAYTATGPVAELTFKVLVETDEQISVELEANQKNIVNAEAKPGVLTVSCEALTINVVGDDHKCDANNTVEKNNSALEPTCTEAGKTADKLCAFCGKTLVEGEEILANDHSWEATVATAPNCGVQGEELLTCSVCGETKVGQQIPATGEHTFGEYKVTTPATVEAEGVETRTCSVCGREETRVIEKLPAPVKTNDNNTLLIVIIVVVVLAGAGVAAYFVLKNKKK